MGAARKIKGFIPFLQNQRSQGAISEFCSTQNKQWKFIPEHTPHFGGFGRQQCKAHLRHIVGNVKLAFGEFTTVLAQVESCLNSRLFVSLPLDMME